MGVIGVVALVDLSVAVLRCKWRQVQQRKVQIDDEMGRDETRTNRIHLRFNLPPSTYTALVASSSTIARVGID